MTRPIYPDCLCGYCFHAGPAPESSTDCPFAKAVNQHDHERELEADERRFERRQGEASEVSER